MGDEGGWDRRGRQGLKGDGGGYRVRGGPIGGGRDMLVAEGSVWKRTGCLTE